MDNNIKYTPKAGCILIRKEDKTIALVYREQYDDYSFPKGHVEKGESLIECAIRETAEETKRVAKILEEKPLHIEHYETPNGENVKMTYFLAEDIGPSDNKSLDTHPTFFIPFDEVHDKLSYSGLRIVWNDVKDKVESYFEPKKQKRR